MVFFLKLQLGSPVTSHLTGSRLCINPPLFVSNKQASHPGQNAYIVLHRVLANYEYVCSFSENVPIFSGRRSDGSLALPPPGSLLGASALGRVFRSRKPSLYMGTPARVREEGGARCRGCSESGRGRDKGFAYAGHEKTATGSCFWIKQAPRSEGRFENDHANG